METREMTFTIHEEAIGNFKGRNCVSTSRKNSSGIIKFYILKNKSVEWYSPQEYNEMIHAALLKITRLAPIGQMSRPEH